MKQRSLSLVMAVLLVTAFSLLAVALLLQTYGYARGAVDREIRESFRQLHHALQLTLDYQLDSLQHDLTLLASDNQAGRYLEQNQLPLLERMLSEWDSANPEVAVDFRFITVDGKIAWAGPGVELYGLSSHLSGLAKRVRGKYHWQLQNVMTPQESLVMLLQKAPVISPVSGKVLGELYGGMVLNGNMRLAYSLRSVTQAEAVGIAYQGRLLTSSREAGSPLGQLSSSQLEHTGQVMARSPDLLFKGDPVQLNGRATELQFFSVVKNDVFTAIQRSYLQGALWALLAVIVLSLLLTLLLRGTIIRPLRQLVEYTRATGTSSGSVPFSPGGITEFNQVGQALEHTLDTLMEKERSLQDLFDYAFSPIIVWDAGLIVRRFNRAAILLTGFDPGCAIGQPVGRLFPPAAATSLRQTTEGAVIEGLELTDGDGRVMLWNMAPIVLGGRVTAVIAQGLDITTFKQAEQASDRARLAAEASTRARSAFLAMVTHEIRTPMNGILGMGQLLRDTPLDPEQQEYVDTIQRSGRALLTILNDILDFSKIDAGKLELSPVRFNLRQLLEEVISQFRLDADAKGVGLYLDFPDSLPKEVEADDGRIAQVLRNLVGNAIKFTFQGEVKLTVSCVRSTGQSVCLLFGVEDTGIGISEDAQQRLFQAFTQVDASTSRSFGGTGLGLAISKRLVTLMGGEIGVRSQLGAGTSFWFRLTLQRPQPASGSASVAAGSMQFMGSGKRILLAEDNRVNQKVASTMLEKWGCQVEVAENGEQVLERVSGQAFDLILMDCLMPGLDGYEATRRLRRLEARLHRPPVPVVAMTANTMEGERQRCLAAGMNDYLSKPVEPQAVAAMLAQWTQGDGAAADNPLE